jgi:hypothetical protein
LNDPLLAVITPPEETPPTRSWLAAVNRRRAETEARTAQRRRRPEGGPMIPRRNPRAARRFDAEAYGQPSRCPFGLVRRNLASDTVGDADALFSAGASTRSAKTKPVHDSYGRRVTGGARPGPQGRRADRPCRRPQARHRLRSPRPRHPRPVPLVGIDLDKADDAVLDHLARTGHLHPEAAEKIKARRTWMGETPTAPAPDHGQRKAFSIHHAAGARHSGRR